MNHPNLNVYEIVRKTGSAALISLVLLFTPATYALTISNVNVNGSVISWDGSGWNQVQDAITFQVIPGCDGFIVSCDVGRNGTFNIVNVRNRFENIVVNNANGTSGTPTIPATGANILEVSNFCTHTFFSDLELTGQFAFCELFCPDGYKAMTPACTVAETSEFTFSFKYPAKASSRGSNMRCEVAGANVATNPATDYSVHFEVEGDCIRF